MTDFSLLESNLGYQFSRTDLLNRALSHRSIGSPNNERLEYLGDSVIGFIVAEFLFHRFPHAAEGDLTRMRTVLVRKDTLAQLARDLKLQDYIIMGSGELKSGGYNRDSILSDCMEAIIGAIYLDSNLKATTKVLHSRYGDLLKTIQPVDLRDSKTQLQEYLQKQGKDLPEYKVIEQSGEAHNLTFTVVCIIADNDTLFKASAGSRKKAEQIAAAKALSNLKNE